MPKEGDLKVWWIPQVPGKAFEVPVNSPEDAIFAMNVLADYDIFQFENNIKPDYCNAGGLNIFEEGEWSTWYHSETGEDIDEYRSALEDSIVDEIIDELLEEETGTTNKEKAFVPGDIIEYAKDLFVVLENNGDSGKVQEYPNGEIVQPFYWKFEGEECRLANHKEIKPGMSVSEGIKHFSKMSGDN